MANKVKYGLKNVYFAKATIAADGSATYATPKPWPGAVSLSMDAQGGTTKFRADNVNYWVGQSNQGYEGDLETALIPVDFRKDILGELVDGNGVLVEDVDAKTVPFALLFQFEGDDKNSRRVLYNCTATRPSVSGETTQEETEPQTETVTITSGSVYFPNFSGGKNIAKASIEQGQTGYDSFFSAVYTPSGSANLHTVTQTLTHCTSSFTGNTIQDGDNFIAEIVADSTYTISSVAVTMGGTTVTGAYNSDTGFVTVGAVSGDIVVTATAS